MIFLEQALTSWILSEYPYSVITREKIAEQIHFFYKEKEYRGDRIGRISKQYAENKDYTLNIDRLFRAGVVEPLDGEELESQAKIFSISGKQKYNTQEVLCVIYPYGYLSHISAMEWYGITDKIPKIVRYTVCSRIEWKNRFLSEFVDKFGSIENAVFIPTYPKREFRLDRKDVFIVSESAVYEPLQVKGSPIRVSSIGKTFIDMLRRPELCGGDEHVFDVYCEHGQRYAKNIIHALEMYGRKIDKARVGFMLDKVLGVKDIKLNEWRKESNLERGSSKKLSPNKPFSSIYSEEWSLSLNVEVVQEYGSKN